MMKIRVFASGSTGNCLALSDGDTNILIDAGISLRRITDSLASVGLTMNDIRGVLITHEHSDHISGLKAMVKKYNVSIYAPHTVANRMRGMLPDVEKNLSVISVGEKFSIGCIGIKAFHTPHDTDESVGYRVSGSGEFALATDMGCVTKEVMDGMLGAETVLIESNHDEEMLCYGPYPVQLKRRILSDHGHLSNAACADAIRILAENGTHKFILGHISKENNIPQLAMKCASGALQGTDCELFCAPEYGCVEVEVLK